MALFKKNKTEKTESDSVATATETPVAGAHAEVILRPHITEKAFAASQRNVYTFEIHPDANKHQVKAAIKAIYNVTPKRVNIVNRPPRMVRSLMRSRPMHKSGLTKAYVYLQSGDSINFM